MARKPTVPPKKPNAIFRITLFWAILVFGILAVFALTSPAQNLEDVPLSTVIERANKGEITKIEVEGNNLVITPEGSDSPTQKSVKDPSGTLTDQGLNADSGTIVTIKQAQNNDILWNLAIILIPTIIIIAFFMYMMRQAQGQNNQALGFGKSKAKLYGEDKTKVVFDDIAGNESAKQDLEEVVDFLKNPKSTRTLVPKFQRACC